MHLRQWLQDLGAGCLCFVTALPLAAFIAWLLGLGGWAGAIVFGLLVALISMIVELGLHDTVDSG
jgi:hypothetical protein